MQRPRGWAGEEAHEVGEREPDSEVENMAPSSIKDEKDRHGSQILPGGLPLNPNRPRQTSNLHIHERSKMGCLPLWPKLALIS